MPRLKGGSFFLVLQLELRTLPDILKDFEKIKFRLNPNFLDKSYSDFWSSRQPIDKNELPRNYAKFKRSFGFVYFADIGENEHPFLLICPWKININTHFFVVC